MSSNKVNQGSGKNFVSWWTQQNNEPGPSVIGWRGRAGSRSPDELLVKLGEAVLQLLSTLTQSWWNLDTARCLAFILLSVSDHCKS